MQVAWLHQVRVISEMGLSCIQPLSFSDWVFLHILAWSSSLGEFRFPQRYLVFGWGEPWLHLMHFKIKILCDPDLRCADLFIFSDCYIHYVGSFWPTLIFFRRKKNIIFNLQVMKSNLALISDDFGQIILAILWFSHFYIMDNIVNYVTGLCEEYIN